jgi:hypothetical protein
VESSPDPKGKHLAGRCLPEVLRDRHDVVRFANDPNVPPTSSQAERELRPATTQQRICGQLTCDAVTRARYRIRGYRSAAAKHGVDQLVALRTRFSGALGHHRRPSA